MVRLGLVGGKGTKRDRLEEFWRLRWDVGGEVVVVPVVWIFC